MRRRTINAIVMMALFIPVCYFSDTIIFPITMAFLAIVATHELLGCTGNRKNAAILWPSLTFAGAMSIVPFFSDAKTIEIQVGLCVLYMIFIFTAVVFSRGKIDFEVAAASFMGVFYIAVTFSCIVLLRELGEYLYLLVFIGPWASDIFAYLCGRWFGKHKLIPEVSPKKTVEGSIGGIIFAPISYVVFALVLKNTIAPEINPNYLVLVIAGVFVSIISQIGDLTASVIKRRYGIKDYGKIFHAHGGVLDRFDSVIMTAPFIYFLCELPQSSGFLS